MLKFTFTPTSHSKETEVEPVWFTQLSFNISIAQDYINIKYYRVSQKNDIFFPFSLFHLKTQFVIMSMQTIYLWLSNNSIYKGEQKRIYNSQWRF